MQDPQKLDMGRLSTTGLVVIALAACSIDAVTFTPVPGPACAADTDCAAMGICDPQECRTARSCAELLQHYPGSGDGAYAIAPATGAPPFQALCDMTRQGGGWTLLLKTNGDSTFAYDASAWTDDRLLDDG